MQYKQIPLKDFIQAKNIQNPTQQELESFVPILSKLKDNFNNDKTEEPQKGILSDFLRESFFYTCAPRDNKIDLAILCDSKVKAFFEIKALKNTQEFPINQTSLDSKAFYESILYYLLESKKERNNNISFIFLCTAEKYFMIEAKEYEKCFGKDKAINELYENCIGKKGNNDTRSKFYESLKSYLLTLDKTLSYTYFTINDDPALLFQVFCKDMIFGLKPTLDANTLNKDFYKELLYLLGLKEAKENATLIQSDTQNSFIKLVLHHLSDFESAFSLIITWNNRILFLRLFESMLLSMKHIEAPFLTKEKIPNFQTLSILFFEVLAKNYDSRDKDLIKAFKDIPYLNSSLFDKQPLEGKCAISSLYNDLEIKVPSDSILKNQNEYKDRESLPLLEYLFAFLHAYDFKTTPSDIQKNINTTISNLINPAILGLVFEKLNGYKEGSFYTPSFITSYMCKESIRKIVIDKFNKVKQWEAKTILDLYNKINDIKEANVIMDSIRICDPSVGSGHFLVSALNECILLKYELGILCDENGTRLKDILLEIKNDEIVIYDSNNQLFLYTKPQHENIENHKIQKAIFYAKKQIIESCLFGVDINPNSCEITKLRLWIELLKNTFYTDLQKGHLETLPNIDINIKCGNSLLYYFDTTQSMSHNSNIKKRIEDYKKQVFLYKEGTNIDKQEIKNSIYKIKEAFKTFCLRDKYKQEFKKFQELCETYSKNYGDYLAKDDENLCLYIRPNGLFTTLIDDDFDKEIAKKEFLKVKNAYDSIFDLESKNPFEWRFEFPEILDEEGNFLGFDLVIGNPPYISAPTQMSNESLKEQRQKIIDSKHYETITQRWDLYIPFIELSLKYLCKENALFATIVPYPLTSQIYASKTREILTTQYNLFELADLQGTKVFENAVVTNCIPFVKKTAPQNQVAITKINENRDFYTDIIKSYDELIQDEKSQVWNTTKEQRETNRHKDFNVIGDFCYVSYGLRLNSDEKIAKGEFGKDDLISDSKDEIHCKEYIEAKDFEKYRAKRIRFLEWGTERCPTKISRKTFPEFYTFEKIFCNRLGDLYATLIKEGIYHNESLIAFGLWKNLKNVENKSITSSIKKFSKLDRKTMEKLSESMDLKYILGILNSKYANILLANLRGDDYHIYPEHIRNIPIPKIDSNNKETADKIIALVDEILKAKEKDSNADTKEQEKQIDNLVYSLYNLTDDEITLIESKE